MAEAVTSTRRLGGVHTGVGHNATTLQHVGGAVQLDGGEATTAASTCSERVFSSGGSADVQPKKK